MTLSLNDLFHVCTKPDKYNLPLSTAHKSFFFREGGLSSSFCLCLFCSNLHITHPALLSFPFQNVSRNDHDQEGMVFFIFCLSSLLKNPNTQTHPLTPTPETVPSCLPLLLTLFPDRRSCICLPTHLSPAETEKNKSLLYQGPVQIHPFVKSYLWLHCGEFAQSKIVILRPRLSSHREVEAGALSHSQAAAFTNSLHLVPQPAQNSPRCHPVSLCTFPKPGLSKPECTPMAVCQSPAIQGMGAQ